MSHLSIPPLIDHAQFDQFFSKVAQAEESALLLDYDGTLAPFSADRQRAFPFQGVPELLHEIMASGRTRVVIITGRNAYEVVFFLRIDPIPEIWGSHGLQRLRPDGNCEMARVDRGSSQALSEVSEWLSQKKLQHLTEFKPGGIAVHWRGLAESTASDIREQLVRGWSPIAEKGNLCLLEFDGGLEIRISSRDKGDAVRTVVSELGADVPVAYLGDDATDERAFRALGDRGLSVLVRPEWRRTCARMWLKPPDEVLDFLRQWRQACCDPDKALLSC